MQLQELGQVRHYLGHSPVFSDPIWERNAFEVKPQDLTLFLARMTGHGLSKEAREALEVLQGEAVKTVIMENLNGLALLDFNFAITRNRFAVDELVVGLGAMPRAHAQATLTALEMRMEPREAVELMWGQVLKLPVGQITPLASEIIKARNSVRHLRLPYVFWNFVSNNIAAPLFELHATAEKAFGRPWATLAADYETILMIDTRAEVDSFLDFVKS
jgi:hypothetical protein